MALLAHEKKKWKPTVLYLIVILVTYILLQFLPKADNLGLIKEAFQSFPCWHMISQSR